MASHFRFRVTTFILVSVLAGCASKPIMEPVASKDKGPVELPKDLQAKFEIREAAPAEATPEKQVAPEKSAKGASKAAALKPKKAPKGQPAIEYPKRRPAPGKDPLWPGEKVTLEITYFGLSAGDVTLSVMPSVTVGERKAYHLVGHAKSSDFFNMFYRVDDTVESYFDYEGLFSHRFHLVLNETKQTRDAIELNDSEKKQTYYWNRWNHHQRGYTESKEFKPIPAFPQDSLSALYYVRSLPLNTGDVISFPIVSEGKTWECQVTVVRREMRDTPLGRMSTIVIKPETKYEGVLKKQGDNYMWLTDDDRRFLIRVEAKIKIGTITAVMKNIEKGTPPN